MNATVTMRVAAARGVRCLEVLTGKRRVSDIGLSQPPFAKK